MTGPDAPPLSVVAQADQVSGPFRRLVLVSHRRHLAALAGAGADTLVFSTDWMAWRLALDAGLPAIHAEGMLGEWPEERGDPAQTHRRVAEWVYVDGRDATLFRDVSLGKLFVRDVTLACHAYARLRTALDRACARFRPHELVLVDLRAEYDLLDAPLKSRLVSEVAAARGIRVEEALDPVAAGDPGLPERVEDYGAPAPDPLPRRLARALFAEGLDMAFRLRDLFARRRRKVLILSNWATVRGLLDSAPAWGPVAPAVIASHLPKRPALLWRWLCRGVAIAGHPWARLDRADRLRLAEIKAAFAGRWPEGDPLGSFVRDRILESGWLELQATEIKRWRKVFRRHRFARALIGDATNGLCRLIAETARAEGAQVDELLNGMFLTRQRYDVRCGDSLGEPKVDRLLAWGPIYERWRELTGARVQCARVGYPALDPLRRPVAAARPLKRALVLPVYADCDDTPALFANIFSEMVSVVRMLRELGCEEIRVKVHPGPQNAAYYRDVLAHFGLDAEVVKLGPLEPHVLWADAVIGPVNSGAMVECLAMGKPYHALKPVPSLLDAELIGPVPVHQTGETLRASLAGGERPDRDAILEYICSFTSIPNAGAEVWRLWKRDLVP